VEQASSWDDCVFGGFGGLTAHRVLIESLPEGDGCTLVGVACNTATWWRRSIQQQWIRCAGAPMALPGT